MPTISELVVKIAADASELQKGVNTALTQFDRLTKASNVAAEKMVSFGKSMTIGLTLPIAAAGVAMIKLASDTGESLNAASVVFKNSTATIKAWGENAAEQAGLTRSEFYQASAVIGAGLINAGASAEKASEQTIELTKRAADMASIFNTSVSDAMGALQAGLRGEAEPLRRFAVSLDEASVKAKAVAMGLVDSNGEVTKYGQSQARLAIIMEQSNRFQGDFVNTSDQLANATRITTAMVKDQAAKLGEQLLPFVLKAVKAAKELTEKFSALTGEQQKTILVIAGMAAATGPLITGIGGAIKAVNGFGTAMKLLTVSGGPIMLAIAAVAALGVGVATLITKTNQVMDARMKATEWDTDKSLEENIAQMEVYRKSVQSMFDLAKKASGAEKAKLTSEAEYEAKRFKAYEARVKQEQLAAKARKEAEEKAEKAARERADAEEKAERARADAANKAISAKEEAERKAQEEAENLIIRTDFTLAYIADQEDAAREEKYAGYAESQRRAEEYGDQIVADAIANNEKISEADKKALEDKVNTIKTVTDAALGFINALDADLGTTLKNMAGLAADVLIKTGEPVTMIIGGIMKVGMAALDAIKNLKNQEEREALDFQVAIGAIEMSVLDMKIKAAEEASKAAINAIDKQLTANAKLLTEQLKAIDEREKAELKLYGFIEESEVDRLKKELEDAYMAGDIERIAAAQKALARAEIEAKYDAERLAAQEKAAAEAKKLEEEKQRVLIENEKVKTRLLADRAMLELQLTYAQMRLDRERMLSQYNFFNDADQSKRRAIQATYDELTLAIDNAMTAVAAQQAAANAPVAPVAPAIPTSLLPANFISPTRGVPTTGGSGGGKIIQPSGGTTVNIYSPTAVSPSEASSIFKQTALDLAFVGAL